MPKLAPEACVDLLTEILWRQSGSKRRRLASGSAPSTRLLTPDVIATRCPALFWGLYEASRTDRAMDGEDEENDGKEEYEEGRKEEVGIKKIKS